jgi:hypothetical protein
MILFSIYRLTFARLDQQAYAWRAPSDHLFIKEITMTVLGHSIPWGTRIGEKRITDAKGRYAPFKSWLAARKTAQQEAEHKAIEARWDAQREAVRPYRADAARDMVTPSHAHSVAMAFHHFGA